MRNLKKVLSLALALVMLLGMMVVGAGAATSFKDADEIENTEAVDVVSGIGVLQGDENGNFNPDGTLSRAEAAVVIAKLDLGAAFGNLATTNASTFSDVPVGYWGKPYIDYCAARGLIQGDGAGRFLPNDKVSGVQFALMVSRVLGYEDKAEQVGGADWEVEAAALARKAGLTDKVTLGSQAMTRDEMAQVAFNALKADMVYYQTPGTEIDLGNGSVTIGGSPAEPKGSSSTLGDGNSNLQLAEEKFPKLTVTTETDDFGRPSDKWTYGIDTIANVAHTATYTLNDGFNGKDLYGKVGSVAAGSTFGWTVKVDGKTNVTYADLKSNTAGRNTTKTYAGNGSVTEVFVDTDAKTVNVCVINTYLAKVASNYDADDETLSLIEISPALGLTSDNDTLSLDDFADLPDYEKDDYVLVTVADDVIQTIAKAEVVVASVEGWTKKTGGTVDVDVTFNGNKTKYSLNFDDNSQGTNYTVGAECAFILDQAGYVIGLDSVAASKDFVFIKAYDRQGFSGYIADAYFTDGTHQTISLGKIDGNSITGHSTTVSVTTSGGTYNAGWFTYTVKDDRYNLTIAGNNAKGAATALASGADVIKVGTPAVTVSATANTNTSLVATNNTVLMVLKDGAVTTFTGIKNFPTIHTTDSSSYAWGTIRNGYATHIFVEQGNATSTSSSSSKDLVFVLSDSYQTVKDSAGNVYYSYDAIVNGEKTKANFDSSSVSAATLYKDIVYDGDGYITSKSAVTDTDPYVYKTGLDVAVTADGDVVSIGSNVLPLAEDCVIRQVTKGTTVTKIADAGALAGKYSRGNFEGSFWAAKNTDGYVTTLIVREDIPAVGAVYRTKTDVTSANVTTAKTISLAGETIDVDTNNNATKIASALGAKDSIKTTWNATVNSDKIRLTAKVGGAIDAADVPTGFTETTEGKDAVAAKYSFTVTKSGSFVETDTIGSKTVVANGTAETDTTITVDNANALTVAQILALTTPATGSVSGYTGAIVADKFVFTADVAGAVGGSVSGVPGDEVKDADKPTVTAINGVSFTVGSVSKEATGADAVQAVYDSDDTATDLIAAATTTKTMTVCGYSAEVTAATLDGQIDEFVTSWNANQKTSTKWEASKDGAKIKFTATVAGAVGDNGPSAVPGSDASVLDEITAGAEAS